MGKNFSLQHSYLHSLRTSSFVVVVGGGREGEELLTPQNLQEPLWEIKCGTRESVGRFMVTG